MAIAAKLYANKQGKAEGKQNRAQFSMSLEEAESIATQDKTAIKELIAAAKKATGK